jgi:short-subunit dehydrogenase
MLAFGYAVWRQVYRRAASNARFRRADPGGPGWALVTGASSGIGLEFARQVAARGYNVVLVARREGRLLALANELERDWRVSTRVMTADLSRGEDVARVEELINGMPDLTMLVNNAGYGMEGSFTETDVDEQVKMVDVHVLAPVQLTRAALPGMVARGSGAVINVSSLSAFAPGPTDATYSSTKAYLNNFTTALFMEYRRNGIKFQALCPGLTTTEFHDRLDGFGRSRIPRFMWMSAVEVVRQSLAALDGGPVIFVPGSVNRAIAYASQTPILSPFVWLGSSIVRR